VRTVSRILLFAIVCLIVTELLTRRDWANVGLLLLTSAAFWRPALEKEPSS
jgi:hypothetical protein